MSAMLATNRWAPSVTQALRYRSLLSCMMLRSPGVAVSRRMFSSSGEAVPLGKVRNVAIIAHVDHGKTTLVDTLLRQTMQDGDKMSGSMDCNELEMERGITILSKVTRLEWKGHVLNIVDTPGHADFGGEVERVMSMVDGVVLLVDIVQGPRTQTKFVLQKALALPHVQPIVVINKADRTTDRSQDQIETEIFDLFCSLNATEQQLDYRTMYASARDGWAVTDYADIKDESKRQNCYCILDSIVDLIKPPIETRTEQNGDKFSMLVTTIEKPPSTMNLSWTSTGKIYSGAIKKGEHHVHSRIWIIKEASATSAVSRMGIVFISKDESHLQPRRLITDPYLTVKVYIKSPEGNVIAKEKVRELTVMKGLNREIVKSAATGDIVAITLGGNVIPSVADTICSAQDVEPIPSIPIDPPVMSLKLSVNTSPLAGKDGKFLTIEAMWKRLVRETTNNVAIKAERTPEKDGLIVKGRGELQLSILAEQMRREGFEMTVSQPTVVTRVVDGEKQEPYEEVVILADNELASIFADKLASRGGELTELVPQKGNESLLKAVISSRNLMGFRTYVREKSQGKAVMMSTLVGFKKWQKSIPSNRDRVLISAGQGICTEHDLVHMSHKGTLFVKPNDQVYVGQIIGVHNGDQELDMNPTKGKREQEIRRKNKEIKEVLPPHKPFTLDEALGFIEEDECVEITPHRLAIRKNVLDPGLRKSQKRKEGKN
ncbi:hypothetical protein FOL47_006925 [Perkinsus chesapeaki]|uniref:Tr-type G domain-containing protein n=1 Tax=Perkinsus chesapeaki TaxID=330153 RepID=A0A7J6LP14_PERCH|nr:hypothetical protein FOL47_006925 [Perkinsus chesapeaki]